MSSHELTTGSRLRLTVVPGIDGRLDGPEMLKLIAPGPLLVVNADSGANTPIAGIRLAVRAAQPAYAGANAGDRLQFMIGEDTPHRVNPEALEAGLAWFVGWLAPWLANSRRLPAGGLEETQAVADQ